MAKPLVWGGGQGLGSWFVSLQIQDSAVVMSHYLWHYLLLAGVQATKLAALRNEVFFDQVAAVYMHSLHETVSSSGINGFGALGPWPEPTIHSLCDTHTISASVSLTQPHFGNEGSTCSSCLTRCCDKKVE